MAIVDRDRTGGENTAQRISQAGGESLVIEADVSDEQAVMRALDETEDTFGRFDILYNNAGGGQPTDGSITEISMDAWWHAINVDLTGTMLFCRHGIPRLVAANGGVVINTTSTLAMAGVPGLDSYTSAKGGIIALTRSLAVQFAKSGVRVNAIAPGAVATERSKRVSGDRPEVEETRARHLLGVLEPDDIAKAALFLASDDAKRITGIILPVDSGITATL